MRLFSAIATRIIAAALAVGCSSSSTYSYVTSQYPATKETLESSNIIEYYIDDRFEESQRDRILEAIHDWNFVLNGSTVLLPLNGYSFNENVLVIHYLVLPEEGDILAMVDKIGGRDMYILVNRMNEGKYSYHIVTMHEIGHVLGLGHNNQKNTLMYPSYPNHYCIDKTTVIMLIEQFPDRYKLEKMNYCVSVPWLDWSTLSVTTVPNGQGQK